jgi:hypothetical protein
LCSKPCRASGSDRRRTRPLISVKCAMKRAAERRWLPSLCPASRL